LESDPYKPEPVSADLVVLAGDIHQGTGALQWTREHFAGAPVVYVLGNHEFYRNSIPELTMTLKREAKGSNVHILENDSVEINGFTFVGCTLWTDFRLYSEPETAMLVADQGMNDYRLIQMTAEKKYFRPWIAAKLFKESVAWLKGEFAKHDPAKTIVVTHHCPSGRTLAPCHAGDALSPAFASDLEDFAKEAGIRLWVCGHTHYNFDFKIGSTRIYSNQRGYANYLLPAFEPVGTIRV
jgi:Icc-related predicted phosphoesterase